MRVEEIAVRIAAGSFGPGGIFTLSLSAIDIALWDLKGKVSGQPLLGGYSDYALTYDRGVLNRNKLLDDLKFCLKAFRSRV